MVYIPYITSKRMSYIALVIGRNLGQSVYIDEVIKITVVLTDDLRKEAPK